MKKIDQMDIGSARIESVEKSSREVSETLRHRVDVVFSKTKNFGFEATGLKKNAVSYFWGSPSPMLDEELELHKSVAAGLGFHNVDLRREKTRPFYEIGTVKFSTGLRLKAIFLAPSLSSGCVTVPPHIGYGQVLQVGESLYNVVFPPSSGSINVSFQQGSIGPVIKGRSALHIAHKLYSANHELDKLKLVSVNMSSSFVHFVLSHEGRVWQAQMSNLSLMLLSACGLLDEVCEISNGRLFVRPSNQDSKTGSHLKVSNAGFCTYVGKPDLIESTYSQLQGMFKRTFNNPVKAVEFLKTLEVHPSPSPPDEVLECFSSSSTQKTPELWTCTDS